MSNDPPSTQIQAIAAQLALWRSEHLALADLTLLIARETHATIAGQPLADWLLRRNAYHREKILLQLEDANPGLAAHVQALIEARKRRRKS